ncbi:MAG: 3-phosphoshikimate 1-carboxyvinyltransferase [Bacteroidia bacterium]|nr:3-phosphoshikimate 1-carboxyvinyltransferase [Bacteroidia bacterium]
MIRISPPEKQITGSVYIGGSKSLSNRLLVLSEVLKKPFRLANLSKSDDTKVLQKALDIIKSSDSLKQTVIDVGKAGTDMRFLTALLSVTKGLWILTGSERMKQRPIAPLVEALVDLGANIEYQESQGYPPLKIRGGTLKGGEITIKADVSSQFISALLLISPAMELGLRIKLDGLVISRPYIDMTIDILRSKNVSVHFESDQVTVDPFDFKNLPEVTDVAIESDWSSASYWYSICALSKNSKIRLHSFSTRSIQADSILPELYGNLGVETKIEKDCIELTSAAIRISDFSYNFSNCPDLAQTVAVTCVGLGITAQLYGLSTLKIKETDRILALKNELEKLGANIEAGSDFIRIAPGKKPSLDQEITIATYDDHRMAMSFAPFCLKEPIRIANPEVVAKSYPRFWEDLKSLGFSVNLQA